MPALLLRRRSAPSGAQHPFGPHWFRRRPIGSLARPAALAAGPWGGKGPMGSYATAPGCLCCLGRDAGSFGMGRPAAGNRWGAGGRRRFAARYRPQNRPFGVCALCAPAAPPEGRWARANGNGRAQAAANRRCGLSLALPGIADRLSGRLAAPLAAGARRAFCRRLRQGEWTARRPPKARGSRRLLPQRLRRWRRPWGSREGRRWPFAYRPAPRARAWAG